MRHNRLKEDDREQSDQESAGVLGRRGALRTLGVAVVGATLPAVGAKTVAAQESSEPFSVEWERTYGGDGSDFAYDVVEADDGYAFAGTDGSEPCTGGWLVKIRSDGSVAWDRTFPDFREFSSIGRAPDGGYVLAADETLLEVNAEGVERWRTNVEFEIESLAELDEGGYALAGQRSESDPYLSNRTYATVAKVTDAGDLAWRRVLTEADDEPRSEDSPTKAADELTSVIQTTDGDIVVGGADGMINEFGEWFGDAVLVRLSSDGAVLSRSNVSPGNHQYMVYWSRVTGLTPTPDGGYAYTGWEFPDNTFIGDSDDLFVDYSSEDEGIGVFNKNSLIRTSEGGYLVGTPGGLLVRVDSSGEIVWREQYDADTYYPLTSTPLVETSDGDYLLVGSREDDDAPDAVVMKLTEST